MSRSIELPDEVYRNLEKAAKERGLTVADWIAATLPYEPGSPDERPLTECLQGLIAVIDSTEGLQGDRVRTPFDEAIAEKFRRQGFRIP